ncbi:MAG: PIN domain-containing protein [Kiritimatiellae bacterium]|nr:PIN domain-containing protein [Kiritimatiellia bacterium]
MNSAVVDTSVLISFLERDGRAAASLRAFDRLLVPAAVDAEFRAGLDPATKSGRQRAALLDEFLAEPSVGFLPAGRAESSKYAQLHRYLKERGTPIPLHDVWIAAAALVQDAPLCTFDRHFARIPLLRLALAPVE